jgi:NADPH:quinone reductase-like Zn-dependent oxidoreductase
MKAAYTRYGPPDAIEVDDLDKPVPRDNEVLIRVRAASVNPLDWKTMTGGPYIVRLLLGLRKPKIKQLGVDVAGQVEAVGRKVTQFKPGDAMFGTCRGAFAEYACTCQSAKLMKSALVMKPDNVRFEQAAAAPVAALTALQGLRDKGRIQPGQKVLIIFMCWMVRSKFSRLRPGKQSMPARSFLFPEMPDTRSEILLPTRPPQSP